MRGPSLQAVRLCRHDYDNSAAKGGIHIIHAYVLDFRLLVNSKVCTRSLSLYRLISRFSIPGGSVPVMLYVYSSDLPRIVPFRNTHILQNRS